MTTVIKKTTLAVALVLVMAACGPGERSEVVTNSGGILDCPSDVIQYTYLSMDTSQPGGETPVGSLQQIGVDSGLPEGTPREESPGMLVFEDSWKGIKAAREGGFIDVLVLNDLNVDLEIESTYVIDGIGQLELLLAALERERDGGGKWI